MGGGAGGNLGSHDIMQNPRPWPDPRRNHHDFPGPRHGPGILTGAEEGRFWTAAKQPRQANQLGSWKLSCLRCSVK